MFTAIVGSRALIHLVWGRRRKLESPVDLRRILTWNSSTGRPAIRFMETRRRWYGVSAVLIVGSALASLAVRGLNLGIDFTGGVVLELAFPAGGRPRAGPRCARARRASRDASGAELRHHARRAGPAAAAGGRGRQPGARRACWPRSRRRSRTSNCAAPRWSARRSARELANKGALAILFTFVVHPDLRRAALPVEARRRRRSSRRCTTRSSSSASSPRRR